MQGGRNFSLIVKALTCITVLLLNIACLGGELYETDAFFNFIRAVDPQNVLRINWNGQAPHPCSQKWKGVKCNFQATTIMEIWLENLNLSGAIDADSLCKLQNLRVLSLANNLIRGNIPHSIANCRRLTYLNLSGNLLSGKVPMALTRLKHLMTLDVSNNHFTGITSHFELKFKHPDMYSIKQSAAGISTPRELVRAMDSEPTYDTNIGPSEHPPTAPYGGEPDSDKKPHPDPISIVLGVSILFLFLLLACLATKKVSKLAKENEKEILKSLAHSPQKTPPPPMPIEEVRAEESCSELVFFVGEQERFKLDDLLEAAADLRNQTLQSSLYKVKLKNDSIYAVKRLKKLQVSSEEFGKTMRQIGNLKHPNILPLVGYNANNDQKLLIYKYQSNGSLLTQLEDYIDGKRDFPWKLRLSIGSGIARALDFIYQTSDDREIIPHGNLKLSNILLAENEEPLISEYGLSRFMDSNRSCLLSSNGYAAPDKTSSEKGDVFSFGIILLELLTGKTVEKSGIDLPKWVRSMVREEWTGEVFDKEVSQAAQYAFPLLNVALKCVSHSPDDRPTMAEVMEKIQEVVNAHDEVEASSMGSIESSYQDFSLLHTVIPETWDTPGSNY